MNNVVLPRGKVLKRISLEDLLHWTYQRQRADVVMESYSGLHRIERAVETGYAGSMMPDSVDICSGDNPTGCGAHPASPLHPDAETIHEYVRRLRADIRETILLCGKSGLRPDWAQGERLRVVPVRRADGNVAVVWDKNGTKQIYSRVVTLGADIEGRRMRYMIWWDALAEMTRALMGDSLLMSHEIISIGCVREPWKVAETGACAVRA